MADLVTDYQGKTYDPAVILSLSKQIAAAVDPKAIKGGVFSTKGESVGFNYDEATKLLGRAPNAAEQVFLDMARHLANEGVTDLKNADLSETNRRFGSTYTGGGGTIYEIKKDASGNPVISTWSKSTSDKGAILAGLALAGLAFGVPSLFGEAIATTTGLTASELATADMALGGLGGTAGATALAESAALGGAGAAALTDATSSALTTPATTQTTGGLISGAGGLSTAELAQLDATLGGAGGTAGAGTLGAALTTGAEVPTLTNLTGGSGLLTGAAGGITADAVAQKLAADATTGGLLTPATTAATTAATNPVTTAATTAATTPLSTAATNLLTGAGASLLGGLTGQGASNLISGGLGIAGNLLQMQQSKEAAQAAQARIDAETAAAKQAAQFRPVGMTTRFGSSQFTYNPTTGQLESAGYTLSPEAKAQQDRLMALANQGLTQAEQAPQQFAPLQTGAQSLFNLGNKYLAQTPEEVAQRYITQQMNLLQPGRELELANLQNKLQQQGRAGLAVAQGGNYGATTPELQALYNARAMQEAQLAANAQMAGQQQVNFGAGLLGQGAGALGQYYAGQQAAYAPYTTAMGQVQNLEAQGQQPFALSQGLAQQQAQAGANVGRLGLTGADISQRLATGSDATRSLGAQALIAAGNPNAMFGQALGQWASGLFSSPSAGVAGNPLAVGEYANPGYWT